MRAPYRVGLLGLGHVGGALAKRLTDDAGRVAEAAGRPIVLEAIAVAHPQGRRAPAPLLPVEELLAHPALDAIVEVMGGLEPAHTYIHTALQAGRQVITANKQMIAATGPELARLGPLRFEAAVASAIPIVETLAETLASDRIQAVTGILNGTTNAILQAMGEGAAYADALADAQRRGLAEADPSADVDAHDPAAKLAIIAMLAFRQRVDPARITRVGIRHLGHVQLREARERGCIVKLIAGARPVDGSGLMADVRPRLIPRDAPMAHVDGAMNAIAIDATYAGALLLQGPGAGPDAAASAVLADLVRAARDIPASAGALLAELAGQPVATITAFGSEALYPAAS
jgi:homoserine dehydrogenase